LEETGATLDWEGEEEEEKVGGRHFKQPSLTTLTGADTLQALWTALDSRLRCWVLPGCNHFTTTRLSKRLFTTTSKKTAQKALSYYSTHHHHLRLCNALSPPSNQSLPSLLFEFNITPQRRAANTTKRTNTQPSFK
jgi:hypothetical protein